MGDFSNFMQQMDWQGLVDLFLRMLAILLCLTVHETCHGLAALALGDHTAKSQHRLSMNPLRHIDPMGTLMMLVVGFGWAKPVPVDPRYFKHPKSGMAITALAGPMSNFLLAYLALLLLGFVGRVSLSQGNAVSGEILVSVVNFLLTLVLLSIGLGVFNLIPFPPLDGSKVLACVLPNKAYNFVLHYEGLGMIVLVALLWFNVFDAPLIAARTWVFDLLCKGAFLPF